MNSYKEKRRLASERQFADKGKLVTTVNIVHGTQLDDRTAVLTILKIIRLSAVISRMPFRISSRVERFSKYSDPFAFFVQIVYAQKSFLGIQAVFYSTLGFPQHLHEYLQRYRYSYGMYYRSIIELSTRCPIYLQLPRPRN